MVLLSQNRIPLEKMYKRMPPSLKTSLGTMHRIMHHIKEGVVRRAGTSLVITSEEDNEKILVAEDVSTPRLDLGKPFGSISLPMGYSKDNEEPQISMLRVMQQEVFTQETIDRKFPIKVIPQSAKPFMYLDIADVRVSVFHLELPENLLHFSSFKLINHKFTDLAVLSGSDEDQNYRTGIKEIALGYKKYLTNQQFAYNPEPPVEKSLVNLSLQQDDLAWEY